MIPRQSVRLTAGYVDLGSTTMYSNYDSKRERVNKVNADFNCCTGHEGIKHNHCDHIDHIRES